MKISGTVKVFLACLLLNILTSAGHNDSSDAGASVDTAAALIERFSFRVPERKSHNFFFTRGRDGGHYTKLGLVHPFLYIPAVATAKVITNNPDDEKKWTGFFVSLTNPIFHAMLVSLLFFYFTRAGEKNLNALFFSLATGYATLLFPYAKTCHREILQALSFTAALVLASRPGGLDKRTAWGCGALAASIILEKIVLVIPLLPVLLYAERQSVERSWRRLIPLLVPLAVACVVWVVYWKGIVGSPSVTGYGASVSHLGKGTAWTTPFWRGMFSQFLRIESGVFWFSPVLAIPVGLWIKKALSKKLELLDAVSITTIVLLAAVHAKWFEPTGSGPLGPRYLVAVVPLFAFALHDLSKLGLGRVWSVCALILLVWSSILQTAFILIKPQMYETIRYFGTPVARKQYETQWIATFRIIGQKLSGQPEVYSTSLFNPSRPAKEVDLRPYRSYAGFNFWWAHWWRERQ